MARRKRTFSPKDPFADLDADFRDAAQAEDTEALRRRLARVAANQEENLQHQKDDVQLKEARKAASDAGVGYRDATKMNRLRTQWCLRVLRDRGVEP